MDTAQWPQGISGVVKQVETSKPGGGERKPRPQKEQAVHCPRCSSTNTKFCYYNNYSLSQPRYFCKTCRRYWTEGGSLRNVPVGGGSRKNKRSSYNSAPSSSSSSSKKAISDANFLPQNPNNNKFLQGHDLNLSYNPSPFDGNMSEFVLSPSFGAVLDAKNPSPQNPIVNSSAAPDVTAMELLKGTGNVGFDSIPFPWNDYNFKPALSFSIDGLDHQSGGSMQGVDHHQAHCASMDPSRNNILFPFEELKSGSGNNDHQFAEQDRVHGEEDQHSNGFNWNGMLAGGSW